MTENAVIRSRRDVDGLLARGEPTRPVELALANSLRRSGSPFKT